MKTGSLLCNIKYLWYPLIRRQWHQLEDKTIRHNLFIQISDKPVSKHRLPTALISEEVLRQND